MFLSGVSSVELGVAYGLGTKIYVMERIKDAAVDILVRGVLSPEELISRVRRLPV